MHRLILLGRVDFLDSHGEELGAVVAQPKRFALVAYTFNAAISFCRRESCSDFFGRWNVYAVEAKQEMAAL